MSDHSKILGASSSLILHAKHQEDEESKAFAITEAIDTCISSGDHMALVTIFFDTDFAQEVRNQAKRGFLQAAMVRCNIEGNEEPIYDLIAHEGLPSSLRKDFTEFMLQKYTSEKNEQGLLRLSSKGIPYEISEAAGEQLLKIAKEGMKFSLLLELATNPDIIFETRKPAGLALIRLAIECGNYPILQRMGEFKLTTDVHIELDGKVDIAASKAIDIAIRNRDTKMLEEIANNASLGERVRLSASKNLSYVTSSNERPDNLLGRELIERLRRGGQVAVKTEPPTSGPKQRQ